MYVLTPVFARDFFFNPGSRSALPMLVDVRPIFLYFCLEIVLHLYSLKCKVSVIFGAWQGKRHSNRAWLRAENITSKKYQFCYHKKARSLAGAS